MNQSLVKIAYSAVLATLAFDISGWVLTGTFWDIPALLASKLDVPLLGGALMHYAIGMVLTVLFLSAAPLLPGGRWTKPLLFTSVETLLGVWLFMMPLLGAGAFGLALGATFPVISLARHWAFGLVLAALQPRLPDHLPRSTGAPGGSRSSSLPAAAQ